MEAAEKELARLQALKLAAEQKRNELRARLGLPPLAVVVQAGRQATPVGSSATATAAGAAAAPGSASDEGSAGAATAAREEGKGAASAPASASAAGVAAGEDDSALSAVERHQIRCAQKLGIVHVLESLLLRPAAQEVSAG